MKKGKPEAEVASLVDELTAMHREYWRLRFDTKPPTELGGPANPQQLAKIETLLGKPLPPSYRAFLELHNGWSGFDGDGKLLAVEDHGSEWVQTKKDTIDMLFGEEDEESPFEKGAIPIMMGESIDNYLVLDPGRVRADGEMDFVYYDFAEEEARFKNFAAFLRRELKTANAQLKDQKAGIKGEDDKDEADDEDDKDDKDD